MKFLLIVFLCFSLSAQWPKPNEVKIILSANSSNSDKKIANEMAKFFSMGDAFIQEDMIVEDNYAE